MAPPFLSKRQSPVNLFEIYPLEKREQCVSAIRYSWSLTAKGTHRILYTDLRIQGHEPYIIVAHLGVLYQSH